MPLYNRLNQIINTYQHIFAQLFRDPKSPAFAVAGIPSLPCYQPQNSLNDFLERAILWNTPKQRKTIEKRTLAKYGGQEWGTGKLMRKDHKIRSDYRTGEYFQLGKLAPETYRKVIEETKEIQEKMMEAFSNSYKPKDKEVVVLYENESNEDLAKEGKQIVEMKKPRPAFFSPNLTQKAKTKSDSSRNTTVRPTSLG